MGFTVAMLTFTMAPASGMKAYEGTYGLGCSINPMVTDDTDIRMPFESLSFATDFSHPRVIQHIAVGETIRIQPLKEGDENYKKWIISNDAMLGVCQHGFHYIKVHHGWNNLSSAATGKDVNLKKIEREDEKYTRYECPILEVNGFYPISRFFDVKKGGEYDKILDNIIVEEERARIGSPELFKDVSN